MLFYLPDDRITLLHIRVYEIEKLQSFFQKMGFFLLEHTDVGTKHLVQLHQMLFKKDLNRKFEEE